MSVINKMLRDLDKRGAAQGPAAKPLRGAGIPLPSAGEGRLWKIAAGVLGLLVVVAAAWIAVRPDSPKPQLAQVTPRPVETPKKPAEIRPAPPPPVVAKSEAPVAKSEAPAPTPPPPAPVVVVTPPPPPVAKPEPPVVKAEPPVVKPPAPTPAPPPPAPVVAAAPPKASEVIAAAPPKAPVAKPEAPAPSPKPPAPAVVAVPTAPVVKPPAPAPASAPPPPAPVIAAAPPKAPVVVAQAVPPPEKPAERAAPAISISKPRAAATPPVRPEKAAPTPPPVAAAKPPAPAAKPSAPAAKPSAPTPAADAVRAAAPPQDPAKGSITVDRQGRDSSRLERASNEYRSAVELMNQGRVDPAIDAYAGVLRVDPKHASARQALVALLISRGRAAEAQGVLREGLAIMPENTGWAMLLARLQVEGGDAAGASATLDGALPYAKNRPDYHAFVGTVLQMQGRHNEAIAHYEISVRLSPESGRYLTGLAISLEEEKRLPEAREAYQRALATNTLSQDLQAYVERKLRQLK